MYIKLGTLVCRTGILLIATRSMLTVILLNIGYLITRVLKYLRCKYFVDKAVCRKVLAGSEVLKMEHQLTRNVFRLSHLICVRITTDDHASRLLH